jgi:hypothetical protein
MILSARKVVDEVLCVRAEVCFDLGEGGDFGGEWGGL